MESTALTAADGLVASLRDHGVRHVFGYPGGQLTPIYDALYRERSVRHILARNEQAAAFMADGYARATGEPGVCLAVCGPGVLNAATALGTSFTDSIPVLLISGQVPSKGLGLRSGYYHENDQLTVCSTLAKGCIRVLDPAKIISALEEALALLTAGRPGPVLLEIPIDVLRSPLPSGVKALASVSPTRSEAGAPERQFIALADLVGSWRRPLILAGGGVVRARAEEPLRRLAELLGAPVITTANGKGAISADHPLHAGLPWHRATSDLSEMASLFSPLLSQGDGLLAIGCRFTQLATGSWTMPLPPSLAQIDIDSAEIGRHYPVACGIRKDAGAALTNLLEILPREDRQPWAAPFASIDPWRLPGLDIVDRLRRVLPRDGIVVADITRLAYVLLAEFPVYEPRTFLHPSGSVAMGYGIPAALGAKTAFPDRKVVAVVGDGCFQMSGMELASAVQENLPIIVILINDNCLTLIKATQERRYASRFIGVDLQNPDFALFAKAFGAQYWRADTERAFESALAEVLVREVVGLIEVRPPVS